MTVIKYGWVDRGSSGVELEREMAEALADQEAERKAAQRLVRQELNRQLDVEAAPVFLALKESIGAGIETELGWASTAEHIDALEERGELSDGQAAELNARLRRLALGKGWLTAEQVRASAEVDRLCYGVEATTTEAERLLAKYLGRAS